MKNISLKAFNTFHIEAQAAFFSSFASANELDDIVKESEKIQEVGTTEKMLILGGGSNMLFVNDFHGLVLQNKISGIKVLSKNDDFVLVESGAGVIWHCFVLYCIQHGFGGVENLSLIPGTVGASPIQNIGAYGVEVKDVIEEVHVYDIFEKSQKVISCEACKFGYRTSIFKTTHRNHYIVTSVVFKLNLKHHLRLEYGAIRHELDALNITDPTIKDVSDAVIRIRSSKLPDPNVIGNAGSFFKNPVVSQLQLDKIKSVNDAVVFNKVEEGYKLAAGWLIEQAGWKGYRKGDAGVHEKQALVLVNYGNASGKDILDLANMIQDSVFNIFGVRLEKEVNIIGEAANQTSGI